MAIDHDGLYKAVINEFFIEFLELFVPELAEQIDPTSIKEKEQELISDYEGGTTLRADIVREVKYQDTSRLVLILIEPQSYNDEGFGERLYHCFTRLYDKYKLRIIPIAIFSYPSPKKEASQVYTMIELGRPIVTFQYWVVQLNRLRWQAFAERGNPVAAAFMAQMQVGKKQ